MNFSENLDHFENSPDYPVCNGTSRVNLETAIAMTITAVLGLVGNSLSGIVLCIPQMRTIHSLLLCMLALSDSVQLINFLIFFGHPVVGLRYNPIYAFPVLAKLLAVTGYASLTCSTYLTVLLTTERYMAVCVPHKRSPLFPTKKRMMAYVLGTMAFSILFNLVKWWETIPCKRELVVFQSDSVVRRSYHMSLDPTLLKEDPLYDGLYTFGATVLINFLIPFLILSVLNVFIYKGMKAADRRKRRISMGRPLHDSTITLMLVVVVAVFCFCNMFYMVSKTLGFICREIPGMGCASADVLFQLQIYLYSFNASINFVIYCCYGRKFRQHLFALFHGFRVYKQWCNWRATKNIKLPGSVKEKRNVLESISYNVPTTSISTIDL